MIEHKNKLAKISIKYEFIDNISLLIDVFLEMSQNFSFFSIHFQSSIICKLKRTEKISL